MPSRTTLRHTFVATLAGVAVAASPAVAEPIDRVDRFDSGSPVPHQDLRGEHARDAARAELMTPSQDLRGERARDAARAELMTPKQDLRGEHAQDAARSAEQETFQPGQPTWPAYPTPAPKPEVKSVSGTSSSDGGLDDTWLIVGIGLATAGVVGGAAAGVTRRVRARRVAA
jgi:hypothetical protein